MSGLYSTNNMEKLLELDELVTREGATMNEEEIKLLERIVEKAKLKSQVKGGGLFGKT